MAGVEILSSETIYNSFIPIGLAIVGLILGICFLIIFGLTSYCDAPILTIIFGIMGFVLFIISFFGGSIKNKNNIDYIEYKVTVEDSVSMTEFLDKYEILETEGKIYIIKEKSK